MKTKNMTLIALMIALLAVSAQFSLPIGPVAITLQTFIVLLIGALLPPRDAVITTSLYLFLGLIGAPVFSGFNGGVHSFLLPSFGFILSWVPAATLQSIYFNKTSQSNKHLTLSFLLNYVITYFIGLIYMAIILNARANQVVGIIKILWVGLIPSIFGDLLKMVVAALLVRRLQKYI